MSRALRIQHTWSWPNVRERKWKALAIGGTSDHAHALVGLPSSTVAHAVQVIKNEVDARDVSHEGLRLSRRERRVQLGIGGIAETVAYVSRTRKLTIARGRFRRSSWRSCGAWNTTNACLGLTASAPWAVPPGRVNSWAMLGCPSGTQGPGETLLRGPSPGEERRDASWSLDRPNIPARREAARALVAWLRHAKHPGLGTVNGLRDATPGPRERECETWYFEPPESRRDDRA